MEILIVHETETESTEEKQKEITANTMAEKKFVQELVQIARTIVYKLLPKTSLLVTISARGIVQPDAFT